MNGSGTGFRIELQYRLGRDAGAAPPLSHPLVSLLRAVRDGGSIQAAARRLGVSYRYAWGALRRAETELGCELLRWVQGEGSVLTERGHALVHAEDLALSRLAPQLEALRGELARAFDAALGPRSAALTVFASHDVALPALRDLAQGRGLQLDLRFLGSVDSLRALAAGRCTVAGFHAPLDAPAGSGYARQLKPLLQPGLHKLIGFALRTQGLIVAPRNPRGLRSVGDLVAPGLRFVSRQPGSGTRLLIDALLAQAGLDPTALRGGEGPELIEDSHLAVAAAVACGVADVGIGIESAARAFGLDFVPLARERYAFVCLKPALEDPAVGMLRELLASSAWRERLCGLPGYAEDGGGEVLRLTQALPWWDEVVRSPRARRVGAG